MSALVQAADPGYVAPSSHDFELPAYFGDSIIFTKPTLLMAISVLMISVFFIVTARRRAMVPGKLQFAGESAYSFVRDSVARDVIGGKDFQRFVPFLVALFAFILVNNLYGIIPLAQFPTMSRIAFPIALAVIAWIVFNYAGIRRHGFVGYFKNMLFPPGVPKPVYILLAPIEFVSTFLARPVTLSLRLFANMFAGHMLLLIFMLGGQYMMQNEAIVLNILSPASFAMAIVMTFFEALIQVLQAYIFTLLTAIYIAGALVEEH